MEPITEDQQHSNMEQNNSSNCKGCRSSVHVSKQDIERMLGRMAKSGKLNTVDENLYQHRLAACQDCPSFAYSTTCLHCGCIMQVKAKLPDASCPCPEGSRW